MVKNALKKSLVSLLCLSLISCAIPSGYSRQEIAAIIKETYKKEFGLDVSAWMADDTLWLYAPLKLFDKDGQPLGQGTTQLDQELNDNQRRIISTLTRIFLNMDKPPHFYVVVIADTGGSGLDHYIISFVPDRIKFDRLSISRGDYLSRIVHFYIFDPRGLLKAKGEHLNLYDLGIQEFIALLIEKDINLEFLSEEAKEVFVFNSLEIDYNAEGFTVAYDIQANPPRRSPEILEKIERIIEKIFESYRGFITAGGVTITDKANKKIRELSFPLSDEPDLTLGGNEETVDTSLIDLQRLSSYYFRGREHQTKGDLIKAKESYLKVLEIMPKHSYSLLSLGAIELALNQPKKAIPLLEQVIEINPRSQEAHYLLGQAYINSGRFDKAIKEFKASLEIEPQYTEAIYALAVVYNVSGQYRQAVDYLTRSLELMPEGDLEIYTALGSSHISLKEYGPALDYYQKALKLEPENIVILSGLSEALYNLNRGREAISYLKKIIEINREFTAAYYSLGRAYLSLSQYNEALNNYLRVIELNPEFAEGYLKIGSIYQHLNQPQKTRDSFQKAKELFLRQKNYDAAAKVEHLLQRGPEL